MTARNDITGDLIATKGVTDAYRDNWDRIFGKKEVQQPDDQGPEFSDGCDHEGFPGGCQRFGHTVETCPHKDTK